MERAFKKEYIELRTNLISIFFDVSYFQYERYQRFATEEFLLREGGVMCPAPGCGEGIFPEDTRRIQCVRPECQVIYTRLQLCSRPIGRGPMDISLIPTK